MATDLFHPPVSAITVSDEILLSIFQHLTPSDLCHASRTCKRWKRVANDRTLWRCIDFRREELKPVEMWSIANSHLSDAVRAIHFKARLHNGNLTLASPSRELLNSVLRKCSNLEELSFIQVRMTHVSIAGIPRHLRKLSLVNTSIGSGRFVPSLFEPQQRYITNDMLDRLTHLNLSGSIHVRSGEFISIVRAEPPLEYLNANCLPCIREGELRVVSEHLKGLKHLEISRTNAIYNWQHHVFSKLKKLVYLDISYSGCIDNDDLGMAATNLPHLRTLNISDCLIFGRNSNALQLITRLNSLSRLDVTRTVLARQHHVDALERSLPNCTIITGSPLLPKLPWKENVTRTNQSSFAVGLL